MKCNVLNNELASIYLYDARVTITVEDILKDMKTNLLH
jgi:hypothetical protein